MKKLFTLILAILCLLTMLSIPALAADAGVERMVPPVRGMIAARLCIMKGHILRIYMHNMTRIGMQRRNALQRRK